MKRQLVILLFFSYISGCSNLFAQRKDSTLMVKQNGDSIYYIRENICKNMFIGNSWHIATGYNLSKTNEFDINLGRTFGNSILTEHHGQAFTTRSWGAGFGLTSKRGKSSQIIKVFWEYSIFSLGTTGGVRLEYIHDITNNANYLRPYYGISLIYLDIFYSYSFKLSGNDNIFKHGVTFRINYFHREKNWQKNYWRKQKSNNQ